MLKGAAQKPEQAPTNSQPTLDTFSENIEFTPNMIATFAQNPIAFNSWVALLGSLSKALDVKTRDSIGLAVSEVNDCNDRLTVHSFTASSPSAFAPRDRTGGTRIARAMPCWRNLISGGNGGEAAAVGLRWIPRQGLRQFRAPVGPATPRTTWAFNLEGKLPFVRRGPSGRGARIVRAMAAKENSGPKRARGRPMTFDRSVALHHAMELFWERGYEGTTFDDLIATMGISPSSFYNAFASKERLYEEATEAYAAHARQCIGGELWAGTDTRTAFHLLLTAAAREFTREGQPTGCMISLAGTHVPPALACVHDMMARYRQAAQAAMAERIRQGIAAGDVPAGTNAEALAAFYSALSRGMAVQARDGASREQLLQIVEAGMRAWPAAPARTRGNRPAKRA